MDHRRLQRALFRMQHDRAFAARLHARDAEAVRSAGLGAAELACLAAADLVAVAADRDGKRRGQLLYNLSSELPASIACGPAGDGARGWIEAFPASNHFHVAIAEGGRLPLAFASHVEEVAAKAGSAEFRALVMLEVALTRARRRAPESIAAPPAGCVLRAPSAMLLQLPAGTHALAEQLIGTGASRLRVDGSAEETLLLFAEATDRHGALRTVRVEALAPLVALFLMRAEQPMSHPARDAFAREHGVDADDVESVSAELVVEGVLLTGNP